MATKRKQPKPLGSPQRGDAFSWDVQPFQFMKDLKENYTQTVMQATQARSQTIAEEATRWMRQNASWQDTDVTRGREPNKETIYPAGTARKGLRAYVMRFQEDTTSETAARVEAVKKDQLRLDELQKEARERREPLQAQRTRARLGTKERKEGDKVLLPYAPPNPVEERRLSKRLKQRQYRKPTRVPKGQSAVKAFEKGEAGRRIPLVEVKFTHNTDLPYVIWLEIAKQGRYAIISRAIAQFRGVLFREISQIAKLKQYRDKFQMPKYQSNAETFKEHVDYYEEATGRDYEPWSPTRQRRRTKATARYDAGVEKKYRAALKVRNARNARKQDNEGLRVYEEKRPETMTVPTYRSR